MRYILTFAITQEKANHFAFTSPENKLRRKCSLKEENYYDPISIELG